MKTLDNFKKVLSNYNILDDNYDFPIFQLRSPYVLYQELSKKHPYNSNKLNTSYIDECIQSSYDIYKSLCFGSNVIIVYDDLYGDKDSKSLSLIESCLSNTDSVTYEFKWLSEPDSEDAFTCIRHIYHSEISDIKRLFKEIILSDLGGKYDFASSIFIADEHSNRIFHLYDDRGIAIYSPNEIPLSCIDSKYDDVPDNNSFYINCDSFYWENGEFDNPNDLCLHGYVTAIIGAEHLSYPCNVSAAALRMLRTLTENHYIENIGAQMLPCCGDMIIKSDEDSTFVDMIGCDNGIDWEVINRKSHVQITTKSGRITLIDISSYKQEIYKFADCIELFYATSSPKSIEHINESERLGYQAFWKEWKTIRDSVK